MSNFDIQKTVSQLSEALKRKRKSLKLSLQAVEDLVGVHRSTLSRIERKIGTPDADTISILGNWLEIPLTRLYHDNLSMVVTFTKPIPDLINEQLQKDESLSAEGKKFLSKFFSQTYQQFVALDKSRKLGGKQNAPTSL